MSKALYYDQLILFYKGLMKKVGRIRTINNAKPDSNGNIDINFVFSKMVENGEKIDTSNFNKLIDAGEAAYSLSSYPAENSLLSFEFLPVATDSDTEIGDIIGFDVSADTEVYGKADKSGSTTKVVGVYTDAVTPEESNIIPVSFKGRVAVKMVGKATKGANVVLSDTAGVAREYNADTDTVEDVIGYLIEGDDIVDDTTVRRLKIRLNI